MGSPIASAPWFSLKTDFALGGAAGSTSGEAEGKPEPTSGLTGSGKFSPKFTADLGNRMTLAGSTGFSYSAQPKPGSSKGILASHSEFKVAPDASWSGITGEFTAKPYDTDISVQAGVVEPGSSFEQIQGLANAGVGSFGGVGSAKGSVWPWLSISGHLMAGSYYLNTSLGVNPDSKPFFDPRGFLVAAGAGAEATTTDWLSFSLSGRYHTTVTEPAELEKMELTTSMETNTRVEIGSKVKTGEFRASLAWVPGFLASASVFVDNVQAIEQTAWRFGIGYSLFDLSTEWTSYSREETTVEEVFSNVDGRTIQPIEEQGLDMALNIGVYKDGDTSVSARLAYGRRTTDLGERENDRETSLGTATLAITY